MNSSVHVFSGISGGAAADGIFNGVDSATKRDYSPNGHFEMYDRARNGKLDAGTAFDWFMMPVFDGIAGRACLSHLRPFGPKLLQIKLFELPFKKPQNFYRFDELSLNVLDITNCEVITGLWYQNMPF